MSLRQWLTLALLVVALVSGWSIWRHARPDGQEAVQARSDYVLRDYELVALNQQGREAFILTGPLLWRDPAAKTLALEMPRFLVPGRDRDEWEIRAQRGWVSATGDRLDLRERVQMLSPAQTPPPTRIETDWLQVDLNQKQAHTQAEVMLTRPGLTMRGQGLEADFDRRQVSLLSRVRARYVPQQ
jgi:lipopolysaccharide export system protein LptC